LAARAAGDRDTMADALARLVFRYRADLVRRASIKVPRADAEEIASETMADAVRASFRGNTIAAFRALVTRILRRRIADYYERRERSVDEVPLADEHGDADGARGPAAAARGGGCAAAGPAAGARPRAAGPGAAMSEVKRLFAEYVAEHRAGGEADPAAYLERAEGTDRLELAALIDAYLSRAPGREWDPQAYAGSPEQRLVERLVRELGEAPEGWSAVLVRLRNEAKLHRD